MKFNSLIQNIRLTSDFTKYFVTEKELNHNDVKMTAAMILQFPKYIKWKSSKSSQYFSIGILGKKSELLNYFRKLTSQTYEKKKIVIKSFHKLEDISYTHILFIPFENSHKIIPVTKIIGNQETILISEKKQMLKHGTDINFIVKNNKQKFEINTESINKKKIAINSKLINLSSI